MRMSISDLIGAIAEWKIGVLRQFLEGRGIVIDESESPNEIRLKAMPYCCVALSFAGFKNTNYMVESDGTCMYVFDNERGWKFNYDYMDLDIQCLFPRGIYILSVVAHKRAKGISHRGGDELFIDVKAGYMYDRYRKEMYKAEACTEEDLRYLKRCTLLN